MSLSKVTIEAQIQTLNLNSKQRLESSFSANDENSQLELGLVLNGYYS